MTRREKRAFLRMVGVPTYSDKLKRKIYEGGRKLRDSTTDSGGDEEAK